MYGSAAFEPRATVSTYLDKIFVVTPGYAFDSCISVGIPSFAAANSTGPATYPPVPITMSGLNFFIIFFES